LAKKIFFEALKKNNPLLAAKQFKKYPSGETISLSLVFPKKDKNELRLYISKRAGFRPVENDVWFIFLKGKDIWIGAMGEVQWRNENSLLIYDKTDGNYQDSIEELDEIKRSKLKARDVFGRDGKLALKSLENADFKCELNPNHKLFISRYSKKPYLEAHHLLPMALQKITPKKLDTLDNIFCLCPYCHRAIHQAENNIAKNIINVLVKKRPSVLDILNQ
jgi:5-methylcytosine-specific restriction protein A